MSVGADEVGESVMASIAATCILVCHCGRRLARGWWGAAGMNVVKFGCQNSLTPSVIRKLSTSPEKISGRSGGAQVSR